ncbi:MAG TPA: peptidoglycan-binding domain-containing protein [Roseiarcus sp.]|nr:peptidoglycan-binding domain-containing protein [Roseiarcus sp.]
MKRTPARLALVLAASILALPAGPQTPPSPPAPPAAADAAFAAQKAAFLALPLATRKAAQDALVWLGLYNGENDGDFGKRTRDSIVAFQLSQKAIGDGVLSPGQLQALLAAGQKARVAAGFQTIADAKTGARIGAPTKLMAEKNGPKLDFASSAEPDLAALYARLGAETPTRKVAYKAMKPNAFFVVSGQDGAQKFYSRFEKNDAASPPIRGFTFLYPARAQNLDRVALAVANSFEAFPAGGGAAADAGASETPPSPPPVPATPPAPAATALVVAPGKALTALKPDDCQNPIVGGKPARFERTDAATGLAILAGDFDSKAEPLRLGALSPDLVVLSAWGERVAANAATLKSDAPPVAVASLEKSASGAPVFDRSGALADIIAPIADEPKRVAGVALATSHALIEPQAIGAFLGGGELTPAPSPPLSVGAIAEREKGSLLAVYCGR